MADLLVFASALFALSDGTLQVLTDDLEAVLIDGVWAPNALVDASITDVPGAAILTSGVNLTGRVVAGTRLFASDITFASVGPGDSVRGLLVYRNTDDLLVSYHHRRSDSRVLNVQTDGSDLLWRWSPNGVLTI